MTTKPVRKLSKRAESNPNYVNNREFTECLAKWLEENKGKERKNWTPMPNYVAECIMKIVEHYSLKGNWRGYTYLSEMKSEAILTCVKYCHNFDINKSQNAFAYFTSYIKNAFLFVMDNEKKQASLKYGSISEQSEHNWNSINLYDEEQDY